MTCVHRHSLPAFLQTPSASYSSFLSSTAWSSSRCHRSAFSYATARSFRHRHRLSCSASPVSQLPKTAIKFIDPVSKSTVYVVGCVHGSSISADDVKNVLTMACPDAIVLELCESRLQSLKNAVDKMGPNSRLSTSLNDRKRRSFSQIIKSFRGVPQAILAIFLDAAYKLQTVSGLDPGIEFIHPIRDYQATHLVCGDAPARDTVTALYRVFITPLRSMLSLLTSVHAISSRVFFPPANGVNLAAVLLTDGRRLRELIKLVMSASLVGLIVLAVGNATAFAIDASSVANTSATVAATVSAPGPEFWTMFNTGLQLGWVTYVASTMLRFLKVLIADRDTILADSILDTVRRQVGARDRPVTICAVVGLLHVNGILQALRDTQDNYKTS